MALNPTEQDRIRIFSAAELARRTLRDGCLLNAPEVAALVSDEVHRAARTGKTYEEVMAAGRSAVTQEQMMEGVADLVSEIRVEALLDEGTRFFVIRGIGG